MDNTDGLSLIFNKKLISVLTTSSPMCHFPAVYPKIDRTPVLRHVPDCDFENISSMMFTHIRMSQPDCNIHLS